MSTTGWTIVCHSDNGNDATVSRIQATQNGFSVTNIQKTPATGLGRNKGPAFFGLTADNMCLVHQPESGNIVQQDKLEADAFPAYPYRDSASNTIWYMNDGDKDNGCDDVHCETGSSVTVVRHDASAELIKTICVGRGHHVTTFMGPDAAHPDRNKTAFVSNLLDGTISIVNNDPANNDYLNVVGTINLCDAAKENGETNLVPNNAFPHGMVYSKVTDRLYNLNNGYGTIAVINPDTFEIEQTLALKGCSNLLDHPDGAYLIGKGADRKGNADHVLGKLSVIDVKSGEETSVQTLEDFYPSVYRFSQDGNKLYVTSAATGKGAQKENLKYDIIQIWDTSQLPALTLSKEIKIGLADCGRRPIAFPQVNGATAAVLIPNPSDGTMTIMDPTNDEIIDTVDLGVTANKELNFEFWEKNMYGA
jgi:DNA-binding beta-propeller fold protein YncE